MLNKIKSALCGKKIILYFLIFLLPFTSLDCAKKERESISSEHEEHKERLPKKVQEKEQKQLYYCPMHPTYTSDKPGDCPICNMKLVPAKKEEHKEHLPEKKTEQAVEGQAVVEITPERQQLIGVKTGKVGWREMTTVIRTVGRIGYDPELYTTIKEYREAIKAREKIKENPLPEVLKQADSLVENAYHKLRRLGLNDELIQEFSQDKEIPISLLHAQAGDMAWVYAQIYEYESALVEPGQEIEITSLVFPGRTFRGAVKSIDTVLDPMTRSVKVRAEIANPDGFLKPEMFVNVTIYIHLGRKLAIPEDAVLDTGERKLVFLSLGEGKFAPREVKLGYSAEGYYEITSGLREGDKVVTSANFLIDSESKLKSAISGMGEHKH